MSKCRNQSELAEAIGVSKSTVSKYLKRPDWPVRRRSPWSADDVDRVSAWRVSLQDDRSEKGGRPHPTAPTPGPDYGLMKLKGTAIKVLAQGEQEVIKARHLKGELVEREVVDKSLNGLTAIFVRSLNNMAAALPGQLAGDRKTNRRVIDQVVRRIREDIINQRSIELLDVDEYTKAVASGRAKT